MKVDTNEIYEKFCSIFKDNRFTHVGIDAAYNVFRFNKGTHFERHHTMPVYFEQEMLFTEEGMETIKERVISEKEYFYGFTLETKARDPKMFICDLLIPGYSRVRLESDIHNPNLHDDISETLDYFKFNNQFYVSMAIDVAKGFIEAPTIGEACQLFTAPNINWNGKVNLYEFILESLEFNATVFDLVVDLYNKDIWRRND